MNSIIVFTFLFLAQFSFGQFEFYIEGQWVDQAVQQNVSGQGFVLLNSHIQIKNLSSDTVPIGTRRCVLQDSPNWEIAYLGSYLESDPFGGSMSPEDVVTYPCWQFPINPNTVLNIPPSERIVHREAYNITGNDCEIVRYYVVSDDEVTLLDSIDISYCTVLGLSEEGFNFELFPNPVSSVLTISTDGSKIERLVILDLEGRLVEQIEVVSSHLNIDMSNYDEGIYFLKLIGEGKTEIERVVVQH